MNENYPAMPSFNSTENLWIDAQDVMQMLHISRVTLKRWRKKKYIRYAKMGGKFFYYKPYIMQHLYSQIINNFAAAES